MSKEERFNERVIKSMEFVGDILITDPCYIIKEDSDDWARCDYGENLKVLGIEHFITNDTYYGDWGCTVWKAASYEECTEDNVIGEFCADAGLVSVMDWNECLQYNPDMEQWVKDHDWCATVIKDFHGIVEMRAFDVKYISSFDGNEYTDTVLELFGVSDGKVVFIAKQTSL